MGEIHVNAPKFRTTTLKICENFGAPVAELKSYLQKHGGLVDGHKLFINSHNVCIFFPHM